MGPPNYDEVTTQLSCGCFVLIRVVVVNIVVVVFIFVAFHIGFTYGQ